MSMKMESLLMTTVKLILPLAITNYAITTSTTLGRLNLSSEWTQLTDEGLMLNQMKFLHYHKVKQINIRRSFLTTHHKNKCVTKARGRLKHLQDFNNINDHARKTKSLNQTWHYYLRNLFFSPQIHVITYGTRI